MTPTATTATESFPERRKHRCVLTRNTEYHLRGDVVVGVRVRGEEIWFDHHRALGRRVVIPQLIARGAHLWLWSPHGEFIVTTAVDDVLRPARALVAHYLPEEALSALEAVQRQSAPEP